MIASASFLAWVVDGNAADSLTGSEKLGTMWPNPVALTVVMSRTTHVFVSRSVITGNVASVRLSARGRPPPEKHSCDNPDLAQAPGASPHDYASKPTSDEHSQAARWLQVPSLCFFGRATYRPDPGKSSGMWLLIAPYKLEAVMCRLKSFISCCMQSIWIICCSNWENRTSACSSASATPTLSYYR